MNRRRRVSNDRRAISILRNIFCISLLFNTTKIYLEIYTRVKSTIGDSMYIKLFPNIFLKYLSKRKYVAIQTRKDIDAITKY